MPAELFILRHGQTRFNAERRLQGQCNSPLTTLGERQAHAMGVTLKQHIRDIQQWRVVSSPLGRTLQTARLVCAGLGIGNDHIGIDARVQEVGLGQWEQCRIDEILASQPQLQQLPDWYLKAPQGEDFAAIRRRLNNWLAELHSGDKLIVISHGLTGMILRALLLQLPYEDIWQQERPQDAFYYYRHGGLKKISVPPELLASNVYQ
ncbi:histidine phosphatase family protein [Shewanella dokdonensis]|uniref:Histidine phosphatase family protein n=1 Tax=Shewanella dokdonensis TaxID=712036 RepID=A0ABX8DAV2_9GAMM|nr:histidine phosphatase family protein [Shewanella dokdonensis]MCL1075263.1 histidine phosphatase family protein [Shewanella dokdonensis]QVK21979.1 histidine phosphatase family protein [Shewanella dokdonensis]